MDYIPSRGAKHRQGDTWVPLDASFKQYTYTEGLDLKAAVPFDAQSLIDQVQAGAMVNEAEGWVQNLDQGLIQQALTDYQERIKTYIDSQNPEATVGDVLGTKRIIAQNPPILAGSLPYQTISIARQSAALPDALRAKYRFTLYTGIDYNPLGGGDVQRGSEVFTYTASLPKLAGGKLTLSFVPASQADTDLINSYLPKPLAIGRVAIKATVCDWRDARNAGSVSFPGLEETARLANDVRSHAFAGVTAVGGSHPCFSSSDHLSVFWMSVLLKGQASHCVQ